MNYFSSAEARLTATLDNSDGFTVSWTAATDALGYDALGYDVTQAYDGYANTFYTTATSESFGPYTPGTLVTVTVDASSSAEIAHYGSIEVLFSKLFS